MKDPIYQDFSLDQFNELRHPILMIVTATDIETKCLHEQLSFLDGYSALLKMNKAEYTYYVGLLGRYLTIHLQLDHMGSISRGASMVTVRDAVTNFKPKALLMLGIAFGIDDKKQNIGDVLVATEIVPYNYKKIVAGTDIIRASGAPTSSLLLNKFKNAKSWEYLLQEGVKAQLFAAPVFSGEELINDVERRNTLKAYNPNAQGGEMEGVGVYAAVERSCDWILIKGICDFADGNKDHNKKKNQEIAMKSVISLCMKVFDSTEAFRSIGLHPISCDTLKGEVIDNTNQELDQLLKIKEAWIRKKMFLMEKEVSTSDAGQLFTISNEIINIKDKLHTLESQINSVKNNH